MAPPNPKNPNRPRAPAAASPRRRPHTVELPFDDGAEALPTTIYTVNHDQELPREWGAEPVSDPVYKPAYLYVEKGPGQGQLLPVKQGALVIGRASISELCLPHSSVSRRHAQLTRLGDRFYVKDLGSQNGTLVNKVRIETEIEVYPGDQIALGTAQLKLRGASDRIARVQPAAKKRKPAARPTARAPARPNIVLVAVTCVAIGFGLAAVAFAALTISRDRAGVAQGAPTSPTVEASDPVDARAAADATPEAEAPKPAPPQAARPLRTAAPRPAPAKSGEAPDNAAILARYEEGDVAGALALARSAGDEDLVQKLSDFQSAYAQAEQAEKGNDGTTAIRNYQRALTVDEKLSGGWGKHGPVISNKLGALYALVGQHYLKQADAENAALAFKAALKYAPDNAMAKRQLAALEGGAGPGTRKDPIAEAWDEAPENSTRNAIEDAWNE